MSSIKIYEKLLPKKEFVLFESNEGDNFEVTLKDNASNYNSIEVFGHVAGTYSSQKIYDPNNKKFCVTLNYKTTGLIIDMLSVYQIHDNKLTPITSDCGYSMITESKVCEATLNNNNLFRITKVVGYK